MNNDLYMGQPTYNAQQTPVNNYMSTTQNSYQRPADIIVEGVFCISGLPLFYERRTIWRLSKN